jgi:hypothetical protein
VLIILAGTIGRSAIGSKAWVYFQNLLGLHALGHEVFYLEDCGDNSWAYDWEREQVTESVAYPAAYVRNCLEFIGFQNHWIYRAGDLTEGMTVAFDLQSG